MATRTVLIDDMDGGDADVTIVFAINGDSYSLDLSHKNADKFYKALEPFVNAARGVKEAKRGEVDAETEAVKRRIVIREWARKKGLEVSSRGKIPQDVLEAYLASNPNY